MLRVLHSISRPLMAALLSLALMASTVVLAGTSATATTASDYLPGDAAAPSVSVPTTRQNPATAYPGNDKPPIYNGCHAGNSSSVARPCLFGSTSKKAKRVLLFGDSHAAHWFGAVRSISDRNGYRLVQLTKSSCTSVDVRLRLYRQSKNHTTCHQWRPRALKGLKQNKWGKIDVAVISNWHYHQVMKRNKVIKSKARVKEWRNGMIRMLKVVRKQAKQVIILRDSPQFTRGPDGFLSCVRKNAKNPRRCGRSAKKALAGQIWKAERQVAKRYKNVKTVDLSTPYCSDGFCNPVQAGILAFRDDNHFGHTFMVRRMWKKLEPHIKTAMAG